MSIARRHDVDVACAAAKTNMVETLYYQISSDGKSEVRLNFTKIETPSLDFKIKYNDGDDRRRQISNRRSLY